MGYKKGSLSFAFTFKRSVVKAQGEILTEVGSSFQKHTLLLMLVFQLFTWMVTLFSTYVFQPVNIWALYVNISVDSHHSQF